MAGKPAQQQPGLHMPSDDVFPWIGFGTSGIPNADSVRLAQCLNAETVDTDFATSMVPQSAGQGVSDTGMLALLCILFLLCFCVRRRSLPNNFDECRFTGLLALLEGASAVTVLVTFAGQLVTGNQHVTYVEASYCTLKDVMCTLQACLCSGLPKC